MTLSAGEPFADYTIVRPLGTGGMGEVYLAQHPRLPRQDALKVLRRDISTDSEFRQRFTREADLAASLTHPHIVTVHDRGSHNGQLWIATQYIAGTDADQLLRSRYPAGMPIEAVTAIITAIAEALDYAHDKGFVHRDVKPANILLSDPDRAGRRQVYLADFGIARPLSDVGGLTATNTTLGTFAYSAPEQLMGGEIDGRADQYALAATAFHLLAGTPPFNAPSNPVAVISQHLNATPPLVSNYRIELAPLDDTLSRGLAKEPAKRFTTCGAFAAAIAECGSRIRAASPQAATQAADVMAPSAPTQPVNPAPPPLRPAIKSRSGEHAAQKVAAPNAATRLAPQSPPPRPQTKAQTKQRTSSASRETPLPVRVAVRRDGNGDIIRESGRTRSRLSPMEWVAENPGTSILLGSVIVLLVATGVVAMMGVSEDSDSSRQPTKSAASGPTTLTRGANGQLPVFNAPVDLGANCQYPAAQPASKKVDPPKTGKVPTDPATISVSMSTDQGKIGLILNNAEAPCTVNSFASLAQKGFFDETLCHRLTTAPALSVLQCGDPSGTGSGGPGYSFANEYPTNQYPEDDPQLKRPVVYPRGVVAMANAGPDTNGSQFFLVYKDSQLPPNYTVFGTIDSTGLATLDKIAKAGVAGGGDDGKPSTDVLVTSIRLD